MKIALAFAALLFAAPAAAQEFTPLTVTWTDTADNEDGFYVFRKQLDGSWKRIAQMSPDVTTLVVQGVEVVQGRSECFAVVAYNVTGESAQEEGCYTFPSEPSAPKEVKVKVKP